MYSTLENYFYLRTKNGCQEQLPKRGFKGLFSNYFQEQIFIF